MEVAANEGKTKLVKPLGFGRVLITSKDDLTAGDGKRHEVIPGKGAVANQTTVNVFDLLRAAGLPLAYIAHYDDVSFVAEGCRMLPWEVVVRRQARGSILEREPKLADGEYFDPPRVEFYLKTSDRTWRKRRTGEVLKLPCDDPYAEIIEDLILLYRPSEPYGQDSYFASLDDKDVHAEGDYYRVKEMAAIALRAFLVLEAAFRRVSKYAYLNDFKVEFGVNQHGRLLLADVIDCDSWRLIFYDEHLDKQPFRNGESPDRTLRRYKKALELTSGFKDIYNGPPVHTERALESA
ncbi:MAG TPA: phosphoribosylaminoimidazolesuccinocarboxamide synthase [Candidatus Paceibacterota bacterium]|nr:phosphoribosylaminoimidazolesuccinocarboxamide synthase [Candidatus Paceibacterota bacterium]